MDTEIHDFCEAYVKKLRLDKDILDNPAVTSMQMLSDIRERLNFTINLHVTYPMSYYPNRGGRQLFVLDAEDLNYLYEKYSKRLAAEMEKNVEYVKNLYKTQSEDLSIVSKQTEG